MQPHALRPAPGSALASLDREQMEALRQLLTDELGERLILSPDTELPAGPPAGEGTKKRAARRGRKE